MNMNTGWSVQLTTMGLTVTPSAGPEMTSLDTTPVVPMVKKSVLMDTKKIPQILKEITAQKVINFICLHSKN